MSVTIDINSYSGVICSGCLFTRDTGCRQVVRPATEVVNGVEVCTGYSPEDYSAYTEPPSYDCISCGYKVHSGPGLLCDHPVHGNERPVVYDTIGFLPKWCPKLKRASTRKYPMACRSAFCGRIECPSTCRALPALMEFKAWRDRTKAVCPDPIWSPIFYMATEKE